VGRIFDYFPNRNVFFPLQENDLGGSSR